MVLEHIRNSICQKKTGIKRNWKNRGGNHLTNERRTTCCVCSLQTSNKVLTEFKNVFCKVQSEKPLIWFTVTVCQHRPI